MPRPDLVDPGTPSQRAGIQSVEVGFALLEALSQQPGAVMLRDLAAAAGMSAAKAHRYLASFQRLGLVTQDAPSARYDLGPAALRLGLASLSRLDAVRLARQRADALALEMGHTVGVAVWGNQGPTLVHWAEAPQAVPVTLRLGDVMPLLSSATGRCFASFLSPTGRDAQQLASLLRQELGAANALPKNHANGHSQGDLPRTPSECDALWQQTRSQGLGRVVHTLLPGVAGLCAPVWDAQGRLALGLLTMGSVAVFDASPDGPVWQRLLDSAGQLSADLGHGPTG